jgi:iron complex outermembrane receptor protein
VYPSFKGLLHALCMSLLVCLVFLPSLSFAQDDYDELGVEEEFLEEVVVTGTRIKRSDFNSPSPLITISREDFEFSGQPTIEEYLNQMPQVQPDFGRTSNNPGDGTARVNLRGMGAGRTLVLLNGRRLAPSGVGSAVDINNLPRSIMERVEIITGGASTVYGSDAVAGVVNFITRQDYDGLSFDASYSVTGEGDSQVYDANFAYGHNFANGSGNITLFGGFYERKATFAADREHTSVAYIDTWEGELIEGGSSTIPAGRVTYPQVDLGNGWVSLTWNPDGTPRAFDYRTDLYNYAPVNYLQTPLTRYSTGLMATFETSDSFEAYIEAAFTRNEARRNLAPVPASVIAFVNTDNPLLTPETRQVFEEQMIPVAPGVVGMNLRRRMQELGPRIVDFTRDYIRGVAGLRGKFGDGWDVDAWLTYTDSSEHSLDSNYFSESRFAQGLLVDPVSGECFDTSGGCVPLDVFGEGRMSPEGADFIRLPPNKGLAERTQALASVVVTGSPFDIWSGPLDMAFGAEWRRDKGRYRDEDALQGQGAAGVDGTATVFELYTEALVPIIDGSSGHYLGLELGARWSDYENAGTVWTYKAGLEWQPIDSLRFRTMFQHAVRAANLEELFTTQTTNLQLNNFDDPCSASLDPVGNRNAEKCVAQGMPADQIGVFEALENYPIYVTVGGNPELKPESSDTLTIGVVLNPSAIPGLTLAVDYFDLEITDTIGDIAAMIICFDPLNTTGVFCDNIKRDATLNIVELYEPTSNRGLLATNGIDTQLQYATDLPSSMAILNGNARININAFWTHIISNAWQENIVTEVYECAGYFGIPCVMDLNGGTIPVNRITSSFNYISGALDIHLTWRWIEGTRNAAPFYSALFGVPDPDLAIPTVPSYNYFDLGFGYQFSDSILGRFGINNLFDKQPPQMADTVWSNNTDTGLYDVFGRTFYLSVNMEF